ncbi:hypothetical protein ACFL26_01615 [Patescibacteria group bacterium]
MEFKLAVRAFVAAATVVFIAVLALQGSPVSAHCWDTIRDTSGDTERMREEGDFLGYKFVDIQEAWVRPADSYPAVELGLRLADNLMPGTRDRRFETFFFFDSTGDLADNAPTGTRAGADWAVSLISPIDSPVWDIGVWNYDPETGEWTYTPNFEVLYAFPTQDSLIIHVPYDLLPPGAEWPWRAAVAVADENGTAGDSVPDGEGERVGCGGDGENPEVTSGLPEETPEEESETRAPGASAPSEAEPSVGVPSETVIPLWSWIVGVLMLGGVALAGREAVRRRRVLREGDGEAGTPDSDGDGTPDAEPSDSEETGRPMAEARRRRRSPAARRPHRPRASA